MTQEQAIWESVLIAAIVLGGMVLIVLAYFEHKTRSEWRKRKLERSGKGNISRITDRSPFEPILLHGKGSFSVKSVQLARGRYKITYRFPPRQRAAVKLTDTTTGEERLLFVKAGSGSEEIAIETSGTYVIEVDIDDLRAQTQLEIFPLGLPSERLGENNAP